MKEPAIIPEKIHVKQVSIYKSSLDVDTKLMEGVDNKIAGFSFSFAQESGFNLDDKMVRLRLNVLLQAKDVNDELINAKGEYGIEFNFHIENFEDYTVKIDKNKKEVLLHSILGNVLSSIAYSTARGIILQETQNTIIGGVILPVINPNVLISHEVSHDEKPTKKK